ncbi:conserved hypothetical protein [Bradyrhizobium oligotrophicum S58]|uniref:DUF2147 domain-containing protein n=1 Tax=Bradyrhizobium oligotrophicum S58 TaxID=1245469 RepID=M4Z8T2_9BRAD|nr:DUF2147 domain-containing protein [Bradyrhizobium oligotrophicum]BAM89837.1 conserved hypothetical protein [Bradyrhizobium oligotrophicum S58]
MKRLLAVAALVLASSAAQAQYVIEYGGKTIRIDPDRGTVQIPGVYDNTDQKKSKKAKREQDGQRKPPSATDQPAAAPAEAAVTPAPAAPAPAAPTATPAPAATADAPASVPAAPVQAAAPPAPVQPPAPAASAAPVAAPAAPAAPPVTAATTATAPVAAAPLAPAAASLAVQPPPPRAAQTPATLATAAAPPTAAVAPRDPNSPVGIWLTEEKEGKIRIEPCGTNLCGYAVDAKTSQNGEQILIDMRPSEKAQEKKWSGRIFDPNSGSTYDSTIALKGADNLKVQGCAFGGMFCGGQTWTRVN